MDFKLTQHAEKRCVSRKIRCEWIQRALENPVRIEKDAEDANLVHALWPVPEKGFCVLRVIYNENVEPVTVVTAYFENEVIAP